MPNGKKFRAYDNVAVADPMYEDPASEDYDLLLDSPCVLILTPYSSPDLTPMEQMFVKNMGVLRQAAARIRKLLVGTLRVRPSRLSPLKTPAVSSKPRV